MSKSRKSLLVVICIFVLSVALFFLLRHTSQLFPDYETKTVNIGSKQYMLYIADSNAKRSQGLSGTDSLPQNNGVAFVFDTPSKPAFWMKDMKYSLDFIYVNENTVVDLNENISPDTYPKAFISEEDANIIIELNAGEIERNGLQIGDTVELK